MELHVLELELDPVQPFGNSRPMPKSPWSTNDPSVGAPDSESTEGVGELIFCHFINLEVTVSSPSVSDLQQKKEERDY